MTRRIVASGLLRTAAALAGSSASAGRPALSDLRRATSTAYYAVFHQVVRHSCYDFMPQASESEAADIARWFTHAGVLAAAGIVIEPRPLSAVNKNDRTAVMLMRSVAGGQVSEDLYLVAEAVRSLQEARHNADYDPVRAVTLGHVGDAENALARMDSLWRAADSPQPARRVQFAAYAMFLRLAMLRSGGPRGR